MIRKVQQRAQQIVSGFKSPADDYLEGRLDISDVLVMDPQCTFYFRMEGNSMSNYQIPDQALLIVDRALKAVDGAIVIAAWQGELICRALHVKADNRVALRANEETIESDIGTGLEIWGVITAVCYNVLPDVLRRGRYSRVCAL